MAWSCVPLFYYLLFALAMGKPPWLFQFLKQARLVPDFKLCKNICVLFFFSIIIPPSLSSTSTSFQTFILAVSSTWNILSSGFHQTGYFLPFWFHLNIQVSKRPSGIPSSLPYFITPHLPHPQRQAFSITGASKLFPPRARS